jgi:hypothetical protein
MRAGMDIRSSSPQNDQNDEHPSRTKACFAAHSLTHTPARQEKQQLLNAPLPLLLLPAADATRQHGVHGLPLQLALEVGLCQLLVAVLRSVAFVL